jgi:hypothetical protein
MLTRILVMLALVLMPLTPARAEQSYLVNLKLAVAGTAVGFSGASSPTCTSNSCLLQQDGHLQANYASCILTASGGAIAYRIDGTAVTATTGNEIQPGSTFVIQGNANLIAASFIRTGSTSGDVRCVLSS